MEKLLKMPCGIPDIKWIEHRFDVESSVSEIVGQEIVIQLQNVINCVEFLMGYPGFQYNQIYKPCYIYNQNKY